MITPLTPKQVAMQASMQGTSLVPDEVIETFNELILRFWNGYSSSVFLKDIENSLASKGILSSPGSRWLAVELVYIEQGWLVKYDGLSSSYEFSQKISLNFY